MDAVSYRMVPSVMTPEMELPKGWLLFLMVREIFMMAEA